MRASETARLLRVVREVSLTTLVGVVTNNLDRVLVSTHSTVSTKTVELRLEQTVATHCDFFLLGKRCESHIIHNTDSEVVLGFGELEVFVNAEDLCGSGVVRTETVTATYDNGSISLAVECFLHIEVKGFAVCTGFLRTVKYRNALTCSGDSTEEVLYREGTVEVYAHQTYLFALGHEVVDGFACRFCCRTHKDNHAVGIFSTVVVEEAVLTTSDFADLLHVFFYHLGHCIVVGVAAFAMCEECIGVFSHTACHGIFGCESATAEFCQRFLVNEGSEVFVFEEFNLLNFVRGAEAVEEVYEGHTTLERCQVSYTREVHNFLHRTFCQHCKTCLAC